MQKISLPLSLFVSLNAYTAVAGHSGPRPCSVEEPTVNHCAVIGGCGSRGIVGHPLIMQFKPCPQVIVGRSTACLAAPPPSVCVRVCAPAGSGVSSPSQTATLARNMSKWFLAAGAALLDGLFESTFNTSHVKRAGNDAVSLLRRAHLHLMSFFSLCFGWGFFLYSINPHPVHKQPEQ